MSEFKQKFILRNGVTYLNCANMSLHLHSVNDAGLEAIKKRAAPWNIKSNDWFQPAEELRYLFGQIINARPENIALIPSVSYGIAIAKRNVKLKSNQEIVILDQEYPSNVYAWRELAREMDVKIRTVKRRNNETWTSALLDSIKTSTGLIAIPNCHWANGGFVDLFAVSQKASETGAKLLIDASQSAGVYPLDVQKIKPDFLVTVGYKWLLGPYGLAYLYVDDKYLEDGQPLEYTWLDRKGSEDFTKLVEYTDDYRSGARRFDAGEFPAFINIPMAEAALTQIIEWGVPQIQQTIAELIKHIKLDASATGMTLADQHHIDHMVGIKLAPDQIKFLMNALSTENVFVSFRGDAMRISPYLYNDTDDIHKLFRILKALPSTRDC